MTRENLELKKEIERLRKSFPSRRGEKLILSSIDFENEKKEFLRGAGYPSRRFGDPKRRAGNPMRRGPQRAGNPMRQGQRLTDGYPVRGDANQLRQGPQRAAKRMGRDVNPNKVLSKENKVEIYGRIEKKVKEAIIGSYNWDGKVIKIGEGGLLYYHEEEFEYQFIEPTVIQVKIRGVTFYLIYNINNQVLKIIPLEERAKNYERIDKGKKIVDLI